MVTLFPPSLLAAVIDNRTGLSRLSSFISFDVYHGELNAEGKQCGQHWRHLMGRLARREG